MKKYLFALICLALSSTSKATIIEYKWSNFYGDVLIEGFVDTQENAMFLSGFKPGIQRRTPSSYIDFLVPDLSNTAIFKDGLWRLDAIDEMGNLVDIADDWDGIINGDGSSPNGWGFASNIANQDIPYINGTLVDDSPSFVEFMGIGMHKVYLPRVNNFSYGDFTDSSSDAGKSYSLFSRFAGRIGSYSDLNDPSGVIPYGLVQASFFENRSIRVSEPSTLYIALLALFFIGVRRGKYQNQ